MKWHGRRRVGSAGRDRRGRAVLLAVLVWQAICPLRDAEAWHVFRGITFGAHEFGHLFFWFGGEWLAVAGGSLMQLLVPVGAAVAMVATPRKDWFGAVACGTWLAASLADLATYIADARAQAMDLVSFSPDGGGHDWHFLLAPVALNSSSTAAPIPASRGMPPTPSPARRNCWQAAGRRAPVRVRTK